MQPLGEASRQEAPDAEQIFGCPMLVFKGGEVVGNQAGLDMRRGSVLLTAEPQLPPTFNASGTHHLGFLRLLTGSPGFGAGPFAALRGGGTRVRHWLRDPAYRGKSEVLIRS